MKCSLKIRSDKSLKPSKEVLIEQITKMSFVAIGKLYNVSDNAIRKWCKKYGLPFHTKDLKNMTDEEILNL